MVRSGETGIKVAHGVEAANQPASKWAVSWLVRVGPMDHRHLSRWEREMGGLKSKWERRCQRQRSEGRGVIRYEESDSLPETPEVVQPSYSVLDFRPPEV